MTVNISQSGDGGCGLVGRDGGNGPFVTNVLNYNAGRALVIDSIIGRPFVAGTGGAATWAVWKAPSGTAPISGTALHSGTFNMVGTINTDQALTLTTTTVAAGESVWAVPTGTATSAVGAIAINCRPA